LPNGNTLINEGFFGRFFEVTSEGEVVWADEDFSGGTANLHSVNVDTSHVTNAAPQAVYQYERYGNATNCANARRSRRVARMSGEKSQD